MQNRNIIWLAESDKFYDLDTGLLYTRVYNTAHDIVITAPTGQQRRLDGSDGQALYEYLHDNYGAGTIDKLPHQEPKTRNPVSFAYSYSSLEHVRDTFESVVVSSSLKKTSWTRVVFFSGWDDDETKATRYVMIGMNYDKLPDRLEVILAPLKEGS